MKYLGKQKRGGRGFNMIEFKDRNGVPCSLQASSLAEYATPGISAVWLGTEDAGPKVLHWQAAFLGVKTSKTEGWVSYPIPDEVLLSTRMHLNRKQVTALIRHLQKWLKTGSFV